MKRITWLGTGLILLCFFTIGIVLGQLHIQNQLSVQAQAPVATRNPPSFMGIPAATEVAPLSERQSQATPVVMPHPPVKSNPDPPTEQQLQEGLRANNWAFTPTAPTHVAGAILTQEQAVETTQKQFPQLQQHISRATAHLGQLQNLGLQQSLQTGESVDSPFAQPHLVWIVTFSGVQEESSGPPGHEPVLSNELNVIVDARTGTYLMDFVWTR